MAQAKARVYTYQVLSAYDAYKGEDIGVFTDAWDRYLAGEDVPCITPDGLHQIADGSCNQCGRKNYS